MNYDDLVQRLNVQAALWSNEGDNYHDKSCEMYSEACGCETRKELVAAIQELQRDALRYRFLRNQDGKPTPEEFDALIDADMQLDEAMQRETR